MGWVFSLLVSWIVNAMVLAGVAWVLGDVTFDDTRSLFVAAAIFGILNTILKPIVKFITIPLAILTLGIAWFFVAMLMLATADTAMRSGDYARANVILDSVDNILNNGGAIIDPLATSYLKIVRAADEYGYELHQVDVAGEKAQALATQAPNIGLTSLVLELRGQNWVILSH